MKLKAKGDKMKPKNFPERKNQRRKNALLRGIPQPHKENTEKKVVENARDIKTKKDRSK